ncbi:MAG: restriction endonuclease [Anaerolineales bacterium]|nr:restriction endonuclease [Anaerolineales bacterium]
MPSLLQFVFSVFDIVFDFWPILLLAPLQNRKSGIRNMVYVWGFWAVIRLLLFFSPEPISVSLLIPEPLSTLLFFIAGFVLIALWVGTTYWKRSRTRSKMLGVSSEDLLNLPPGELEEMAAELYRVFGHQAKRTGASGDHGVDVIVKTKNGQKWIAQCKRWRKPVGESIVRDFYGTMQHEKAAQGAIIATSGFSQQAIEWAKGKPLYLYNGEDFIKLWKRAENQRRQKKNAG